jgi:hypothetical protein
MFNEVGFLNLKRYFCSAVLFQPGIENCSIFKVLHLPASLGLILNLA